MISSSKIFVSLFYGLFLQVDPQIWSVYCLPNILRHCGFQFSVLAVKSFGYLMQ